MLSQSADVRVRAGRRPSRESFQFNFIYKEQLTDACSVRSSEFILHSRQRGGQSAVFRAFVCRSGPSDSSLSAPLDLLQLFSFKRKTLTESAAVQPVGGVDQEVRPAE